MSSPSTESLPGPLIVQETNNNVNKYDHLSLKQRTQLQSYFQSKNTNNSELDINNVTKKLESFHINENYN